jgi:hypothetical protein
MDRDNTQFRNILRFSCALLALLCSCKDPNRSDKDGASEGAVVHAMPRASFQTHLIRGTYEFEVRTVGDGSFRTLTIVRSIAGDVDTTESEIDGSVLTAMCADLDSDSLPELYIVVQSAGSGSYAHLLGYDEGRQGRRTFSLPDLDKRQAAGYLGHDTLWVRDSLLIRRFPVFTESDFNASASGGTRMLEYVLQRDRRGTPLLQCVRVTNSQQP